MFLWRSEKTVVSLIFFKQAKSCPSVESLSQKAAKMLWEPGGTISKKNWYLTANSNTVPQEESIGKEHKGKKAKIIGKYVWKLRQNHL